MLLEEQVAELLQRCEKLLGHELRQVRGNLQEPQNRAAAVWELLVTEAASRLGSIQYEPDPGGCPDIKLQLPCGRAVWLEATYLYPRFWDEERRTDAVRKWIFSQAQRRQIPLWKIFPRFDGRPSPSGYVRELPLLHERPKFLKDPELVEFFDDILSQPNDPRSCKLSNYSVAISYMPNAPGPHISSGGLVQEAPKLISEHALYRKLKEKADQFSLSEPLIICVGGQNSPALTQGRGVGTVSIHDAVMAAFSKCRSLSAAIAVSIEYTAVVLGSSGRRARAELFTNPIATYPLAPEEIKALTAMNFNGWKYTFALEKWDAPQADIHQRVTGALTWRPLPMGIEIEVPANIVVDALAGKTSLAQAFGLKQDDRIRRALEEGWVIESCRLIDGNIQAGEDRKVVLDLVPSQLSVFSSQ